MKIKYDHLLMATKERILDEAQADKLWQFLKQLDSETPGFHIVHVLYYLGGMVAIGAMSLFMTLGWEAFGGAAILALSLAYAAAGLWLSEFFQKRKHLLIPAGIMATFVVVLTPLAVFGLQDLLGLWDGDLQYRDYHRYIDWRWIIMELATLAAAAVMLWRYRFPFLMMPVAVTLWYLSMDLVPFIFHDQDYSWTLRRWVSLYFGFFIIVGALWIDIRTRYSKDYAFWLYIFGVMTFWGGMSSLDSGSELGKFIYLCINLFMILFGAIISRRVFTLFGALGCSGYIGDLAYRVFEDSLLFPLALTFIGLAVIYLGIVWQKHETQINTRLRGMLPRAIREFLDSR